MEYERNNKYFHTNNKSFYVGIIILAIGIVLFVLDYVLYLFWALRMIGVVFGIAGAICAFVPLWSRSGEKDIEEQIAVQTAGLTEEKIEALHIKNCLSSHLESLVIGGYDFGKEGCLIRLGLDGNYRGSEYACAALIFTTAGVVVFEKRFSLVENKTEEKTEEYLYKELENAEFSDNPFTIGEGEEAIHIKHSVFTLYMNGQAAFSIPSAPNSKAEETAKTLNVLIERAKSK